MIYSRSFKDIYESPTANLEAPLLAGSEFEKNRMTKNVKSPMIKSKKTISPYVRQICFSPDNSRLTSFDEQTQ